MGERGMRKIEEIKEKLRELKPLLRERYKVSEIGVFGSYVRGEQRKGSDLDILVDFYETPDLWGVVEMKDFLSRVLKVKVDLVMKSALKPSIRERILKEVVYL